MSAINDPEERSRIRAVALSEPRLAGRLIAKDGTVAGINVDVQLPGDDNLREGSQVAEAARQLADEFRRGFRESMSGSPGW